MDAQIVEQLIALNKNFYSQFAGEFSETRPTGKINLEHILPYLADGVKILDVGCGNGRLVERLDREGLTLTCIGVDAAPELIEIATVRCSRLRHVAATFRVAELTQRGWSEDLPGAPFDLVTALAVLHHVPSFGLRREVLRDIHALLRPGGTLIMTNWQFDRNDRGHLGERLRKKIVPWKTVGIDERALEPGDALITWKRGGTGYRYCHRITENEVERMAAESGLKIVKQFFADAGLNLYSLLIR